MVLTMMKDCGCEVLGQALQDKEHMQSVSSAEHADIAHSKLCNAQCTLDNAMQIAHCVMHIKLKQLHTVLR